MFCEIIKSLLTQAIGAAIGVYLGIWVSRRNDRKKAKEIVKMLQNELKVIHDELLDRQKTEDGNILFYRYSTPVWDTCIREGILSKVPYTEYIEFVKIYSKIYYAQEVECQWSNGVITNHSNSRLREDYINAMDDERKKLSQEIDEAIKKTMEEINAVYKHKK